MRLILVCCLLGTLLTSAIVGCDVSFVLKSGTPATTPGSQVVLGGELRMAGGDPDTLDPALVQDVASWRYLLHLYSGLVGLDDSLQVVPDLAKSWDLSNGGKTYTFKLRSDAKFHNGKAITARDVKFSLERACDPKVKSPVAATYLGDIVGATDKLRGKAKEITGVVVKDDYTLEITIDAPREYFLSKLTYSTAMVVDNVNVESGPAWAQKPNGSGPFKLQQWKADEAIVLISSEGYYGQKPRIASVRYDLTGRSPIGQYEKGEVDVAPVGLADIDRVTDKSNPLNAELRVTPELEVTYIGLNTKMKPFDDVKVRQAFTMALDRDKLARVTFMGQYVKAEGILPPGMPGYDPKVAGPKFDLTRARQLLDESSYKGAENLPPVTLSSSLGGGGMANNLAEIYRRGLAVGVAVEQVDTGYFDQLSAGKLQMFVMGWVADYPDPQDFLDLLFRTGSEPNHSQYSSQRLDALLDQASVEKDKGKRVELYREAERLILADAPVVPLYHGVDYTLVKPYVKGLTVTSMGVLSLKRVELSSAR